MSFVIKKTHQLLKAVNYEEQTEQTTTVSQKKSPEKGEEQKPNTSGSSFNLRIKTVDSAQADRM